MIILLEDISYSNMPLNNKGLYENSVCVCMCVHVCHCFVTACTASFYFRFDLVQYFNHFLAKQWNKLIRVILLFAMEPIVQGRQKHDIQYQDIFIYYVYLFLRENKPTLCSKST